MKKLIYTLMFVVAVLVQSCKNNDEVPFTIAQNYAVRSNVEAVDQPVINTRAEFDSIFQTAAVEDENAKPTPIDWEKQFVIAVVLEGTNEYVEVEPTELVKTEQGLILRYKQKNGDKVANTMRPCLILVVDKKYQTRIVSVIEE